MRAEIDLLIYVVEDELVLFSYAYAYSGRH